MKKELALVMAIVMMFSFCLSGCNDGTEANVPDDNNNVISVDDPLNNEDIQNNEGPEDGNVTDEKDDPKNDEQNTESKDPNKPDNSTVTKPEEEDPPVQPPVVDRMNWPSNEYTALVPKPSAGIVKKTDIQNGIFCLLLTGADMVDAKAYAGSLINSGFTNDVTETIEDGSYLFGGGNSKGSFVVVSYQSGQFIIGIEP